jgi:hypothetical protein
LSVWQGRKSIFFVNCRACKNYTYLPFFGCDRAGTM